jgi:type II secretory pathway component GspD/PulD (secretin)
VATNDTVSRKPDRLNIQVQICEVAFQTDDLPELGRILGGSLERFSSAKSGSRLTNAVEAAPPQVMTEARHNEVMRLLKQRSDVDFITALRVTTMSGRPARINIGTNTDAITGQTNLTTGVSVEATVLPDGTTIEVQAAAMIKTFIGYSLDAPRNQYYDYVSPPNVDPAKVHETLPPATPERPTGSNMPRAPIRNQEPIPIFRLRQTVANATVWDGQTMVLSRMATGAPMGSRTGAPATNNLPLVGRLFRSESFGPRNSLVLIFITPTIIDPAGNRVNSEKDLPFARTNVPPQRGIR